MKILGHLLNVASSHSAQCESFSSNSAQCENFSSNSAQCKNSPSPASFLLLPFLKGFLDFKEEGRSVFDPNCAVSRIPTQALRTWLSETKAVGIAKRDRLPLCAL